MILSFKTKFPWGEPTYFIQKILASQPFHGDARKKEYAALYKAKLGNYWEGYVTYIRPKNHTIRHDTHNRWRAGVLIHFIVFPRSTKMLQFAPTTVCLSTQRIVISRGHVVVDGRLLDDDEVDKLALNDGFESIQEFWRYFDKTFIGKIVHWTDLRY